MDWWVIPLASASFIIWCAAIKRVYSTPPSTIAADGRDGDEKR